MLYNLPLLSFLDFSDFLSNPSALAQYTGRIHEGISSNVYKIYAAAITDPGVAGKQNQDDLFLWESPDKQTFIAGILDGHGRDLGQVRLILFPLLPCIMRFEYFSNTSVAYHETHFCSWLLRLDVNPF